MSRPHILKKGETLARLAELKYGDRKLAARLADYNGLANTRDIVTGQAIQIPAARELRVPKPLPAAREVVTRWPVAPNGMAAIIATYGDIRAYVRDDGTPDPKWEASFIASCPLPFAVPLDWAPATLVKSIRCHKLVVPLFQAVFADIVGKGLQKAVKTYGGCYNWRMKRGQAKPSTHSWGVAIDLNVRTNAMGTAGDMDPALVALFEGYGFVWGGRWAGANKDPMHFQYCSGY